MFCFTCITGLCFLISLFIKEDLRRLKFGKSNGEAGLPVVTDTGATNAVSSDSNNSDEFLKFKD